MIVYKYGALKPIEGFELMLEQLRLSNRYRNEALEIALMRRAALGVGADKDQVRIEYNSAKRELYGRYSTAGLLGHRTLYTIDQAVAKSVATRWKCWSKTGRFKSPFKRFDGTGSLTANSQDRVNEFAKLIQIGKRKAVCELRVVGKQVIKIPIVLDRELPIDADLADAKLHVDKIGDRWIYAMTFTIRNHQPRALHHGSGACSINFGWRTLASGDVRIATVTAPIGTIFLELPASMIAKRKHVESVASLADNAAVAHLGNSRGRHRARRDELRGKGPSPMNRERFDPAIHTSREHWARRDRHLWEIESNERAAVLRQRLEIYRLFARRLRTMFEKVRIEDYSLSALARLVANEGMPWSEASSHIRFLVAPGLLRAEIKRVFLGIDCIDMVKAKRTKKCHSCGNLCEFDAAKHIEHTCEHCGASWDQDVNNVLNQEVDVAAE